MVLFDDGDDADVVSDNNNEDKDEGSGQQLTFFEHSLNSGDPKAL